MDLEKIRKETEKTVFTAEYSDDITDGCSRTSGSVDSNGVMLLAEINLSELPPNDKLPETGFLQFFIDCNLDIDVNGLFESGNCKVALSDEPYDESNDFQIDNPVLNPQRLIFTEEKESVSSADEMILHYLSDEELDECYKELNGGTGTKLLGYPFFTQQDPDRYPHYDTLLFQLDSDNENVQWGDMGVGNFFINSSNLKKGDFDDVLFYWDCY